jgi:ABC-type multidrug transport system fused ATPase/permease subunit
MTTNENITPPDSTTSGEMLPPAADAKHMSLWWLVHALVETTRFRYAVVGGISIGLRLVSTLFEGIGFTMLLPIMEYVVAGQDLVSLQAGSEFWRRLVEVADGLGITVNLITLLSFSFVSILFRQLFQYLQVLYDIRQSNELIRRVQVTGFAEALATRLSYHDNLRSGDIVNDIVHEARTANNTVFLIFSSVGLALQLVLYLGIIVAISLPLTLLLLFMAGLQAFLLRGLMRRSREVSEKITDRNQSMASFLIERIRSVRLVRLSGTEADEVRNMDAKVRDLNANLIAIQMIGARIPVIVEPLAVLTMFVLIAVGSDVFGTRIELILMFAGAALRSLPLMQQMMTNYQGLLSHTGSIKTTIKRIRTLAEEKEPEGGALEFSGVKDAIRFENVSFDYGAGADLPALDGVTLEIPAGRITALVGPSGSGKSTLIDLLPWLREPCAGRITFDNIRSTEFSIKSLRSRIAFVPQSPQVFNQSVAQHIRYGNAHATEKDIHEAARLAGAADFIDELPDGYDTLLGEDGVRLSGGQRQRLDLARALARKGYILILDEPASGLDADAEEKFRTALTRIREETDMTVILIAHGFSTVVDADKIVVLQQGKVIASGTHDSLMRENGWYTQAFNKQHRAALNGAASAVGG